MSDQQPKETPVINTPQIKIEEKFSAEYVKELRQENERYRKAAKENGDAAAAAETAASAKIAEAQAAAEKRIIASELKAVAIKAGIVDLDGLKLADLSSVKLDDKGELVGGEDLIKSLKEAKPYLFKEASTTHKDTPPPKNDDKPKKATEMTPEEYNAAKRAIGIK